MSGCTIAEIERLELRFAPRPWDFSEAKRAKIDAHFAALTREKPALFNGQILLMHSCARDGATLRGAYLQTDYASFIAWRDWGFPDAAMKNCFGLGALRGSDGGFVLAVMGAHTMNAGRIYFPGGTPDPDDIVGEQVNLEANILREVQEETGLSAQDFSIAPGWSAVFAGPRIAMIKPLLAREPAPALRRRILQHLAREETPELAGVHLVHGPEDLDPRMPCFVPAFLHHVWARERAQR